MVNVNIFVKAFWCNSSALSFIRACNLILHSLKKYSCKPYCVCVCILMNLLIMMQGKFKIKKDLLEALQIPPKSQISWSDFNFQWRDFPQSYRISPAISWKCPPLLLLLCFPITRHRIDHNSSFNSIILHIRKWKAAVKRWIGVVTCSRKVNQYKRNWSLMAFNIVTIAHVNSSNIWRWY